MIPSLVLGNAATGLNRWLHAATSGTIRAWQHPAIVTLPVLPPFTTQLMKCKDTHRRTCFPDYLMFLCIKSVQNLFYLMEGNAAKELKIWLDPDSWLHLLQLETKMRSTHGTLATVHYCY